jgi:hypothetical protein
MLQQPDSVYEGAGMAMIGSALLGWHRALLATQLFPLLAGDPARMEAFAASYEGLATGLKSHPGLVDSAVKNVDWDAPSAELYKGTVLSYADEAADKSASPRATADALRVTATVYDAVGAAVFLTGASILTAGVIRQFAQLNPFTRPAAEVAATAFGRRADHQAATIAAKARTAAEGGSGILAKAAQKLMHMSKTKKILLGGAAAVTGAMTVNAAVADQFTQTKLESPEVKP